VSFSTALIIFKHIQHKVLGVFTFFNVVSKCKLSRKIWCGPIMGLESRYLFLLTFLYLFELSCGLISHAQGLLGW